MASNVTLSATVSLSPSGNILPLSYLAFTSGKSRVQHVSIASLYIHCPLSFNKSIQGLCFLSFFLFFRQISAQEPNVVDALANALLMCPLTPAVSEINVACL